MAKGHCRDAMVQIRKIVKDQVSKSPSAISLVVGNELLMQGLIDKDGVGFAMSEGELSLVFEK